MSISFGQAWDLQFEAQLHATYEQERGKLESQIDERYIHRGVKAAIDHFERLGNVVAADSPARHSQTVVLNPNHSKRACFPITSHGAVLLSNIDEVRTMVEPKNPYMTAIVTALKRRSDKHIISASVGSASIATMGSDGSPTYSTQALLTAYDIDGTGTSNAISLADIIKANVLLSKAGVPGGSQNRLALYSPGQLTNLLNITQASSSDFYSKGRIHEAGTMDGQTFEGMTWIEIADAVNESVTSIQTMLPLTSTTRSMIFMAKDACGLTLNQGIQNSINQRPDLNDDWQVRGFMTMGSVRIWEGGVVKCDVLEN